VNNLYTVKFAVITQVDLQTDGTTLWGTGWGFHVLMKYMRKIGLGLVKPSLKSRMFCFDRRYTIAHVSGKNIFKF